MNIEDLISQYIDGNLSSEAEAELHHRLAVSPEARKLFRAQIALRAVARDQRVLQTPAPELRSALFGRLQREEGMKPLEEIPASPPVVAAAARSIPSPAVRDGRRRRRAAIWLIPFITALLAVAIVWNGEEDKPAGMRSPVFTDARPQAAPEKTTSSNTGTFSSPSPPVTGKAESKDISGSVKEPVRIDGGERASKSVPKGETHLMASDDIVYRKSAKGSGTLEGSWGEARGGDLGNQLSPDAEHASDARRLDRDLKSDDDRSFKEAPKLMSRQMGGYQSGGIAAYRDTSFAFHTTPTQTMGKNKDIALAQSPPMKSASALAPPPSAPMLGDGHALGSGPRTEQMQQVSNSVTKANTPASSFLSLSMDFAIADTIASALRNRPSDSQGDIDIAQNVPSSSPVAQALSPISAAVNSGQFNSALGAPNLASASSTDQSLPASSGSPAVTFIVSITPASYISLRSGQVNLDGAFRAGVELGGRHQIYAVAGLSGYRNTIADSLVGTTVNGITTPSTRRADITSGTASEIYGGAGYRYTIALSQKIGVSPGVWGGVGGRHLSAGVEAPITFRPSRWIRLELTPTIRYVDTRATAADVSMSTVQTSQNASELHQRTTVPADTGGLDVGIGLGAVIVW
ncbi:MAG: hypothetical protein JWQ98_1959 [Chlorobi bacterium]|nr:hypothetical protein [Chlorobiota bacterium]